jgi:hypothetical protein
MFAMLFITSAVGTLLVYSPALKLLDPGFYQHALVEINLYQRLPRSIAAQLAGRFTTPSQDSETGFSLITMDQEQWETLLIEVTPPGWLQSQTESLITQVFDILLVSPDPSNTPVEVSLEEIKGNLAGPAGVHAISQIIEAQPPCSIEQLMGIVQVGLGMQSSIDSLLCKPPDYILSELSPLLGSLLNATSNQIPDQLQFTLPLSGSDRTELTQESREIPGSIRNLRQAKTLVTWSPLLPLTLLGLMTLTAVRSLRDFMVWWGGAFLLVGIASLSFSLLMFPGLEWALDTYLPIEIAALTSIPEWILQIGLVDLFQEMENQLLSSIQIPAGILTVIGFALLLGAYLMVKSDSRTASAPLNSESSPDILQDTELD